MKHIIALLIIVAIFLCGCSATPTETPPTSEPSAVPVVDTPKSLAEMTDYELLSIMAEKGACWDWLASSYMGEYPFSSLMSFSPEFAELLTRSTAAESIRTYTESLMEQYPDSALDSLMYYTTDIEAYINNNLTT